jgi:hypothetical protein
MESQIGSPIILTKYINNNKDNLEKEVKQQHAYEQLITYLYLKNSDKSKYGSLLNGLSSQYALGHDQYPKNIKFQVNILINRIRNVTLLLQVLYSFLCILSKWPLDKSFFDQHPDENRLLQMFLVLPLNHMYASLFNYQVPS